MARLPIISKYCRVRGAGAFADAKLDTMLTPSTRCCFTPFTSTGSGRPAASRIVGATSVTSSNWGRMPSTSLMRFGDRRRAGWGGRGVQTCSLRIYAVSFYRLGKTRRIEDRRCNIGHILKLGANAVNILDAFWPINHHGIARAAKMRSDALAPLEGRVAGPRPTDRVMRRGVRAAQFIKPGQRFGSVVFNAVGLRHHVGGAAQAAFKAGAIVPGDIDDHGVVHLSRVTDGIKNTAQLVIVLRSKARID